MADAADNGWRMWRGIFATTIAAVIISPGMIYLSFLLDANPDRGVAIGGMFTGKIGVVVSTLLFLFISSFLGCTFNFGLMYVLFRKLNFLSTRAFVIGGAVLFMLISLVSDTIEISGPSDYWIPPAVMILGGFLGYVFARFARPAQLATEVAA